MLSVGNSSGHDQVFNVQCRKTKNDQHFISSLRNSRISTDVNSKQFVEYEIACQLFYSNNIKIHSKNVITWSIWRRYSELEIFNASFKKEIGWRADAISFPSSHMLVYNKLDWQFIEKRREELSVYWSNILAIERVTDFGTPQCSKLLQSFLNINSVIASTINVQDTSLYLPVNSQTKVGSTTICSLPNFESLNAPRRYSTGGLFAKNKASNSMPGQYSESSPIGMSASKDKIYEENIKFQPPSFRPSSDNYSSNKFPFSSTTSIIDTTSSNNSNNSLNKSTTSNAFSNIEPTQSSRHHHQLASKCTGEESLRLPENATMTSSTVSKPTDSISTVSGMGGGGGGRSTAAAAVAAIATAGGGGGSIQKAPPGVNKTMLDMKSNMLAEIRAKKK